jgi:hypothetical protein
MKSRSSTVRSMLWPKAEVRSDIELLNRSRMLRLFTNANITAGMVKFNPLIYLRGTRRLTEVCKAKRTHLEDVAY